ncbi:hypothetical protein [Endozoicomonas lisbonensis]|uniref:hypothetical protein n=1 Tax=Endozoicomonas lisbonensis TaxID=3120522 RepID=UPI003398A260
MNSEIDRFSQIKTAVVNLIEGQGLKATIERDQTSSGQRFAVVYLGEWAEEFDDMEGTSEIEGSLYVEVFAMSDQELDFWRATLRPVLKAFDPYRELVDSFVPAGGETLPMEKQSRPSFVLNYTLSFTEA